MAYPGGKGGSGTYQTIINQIPPHRIYIEPFAGFGAIMRMKRPASCSIAIDADPGLMEVWKTDRRFTNIPNLHIYCCNALTWLANEDLEEDVFVYCDPPYLLETRSTGRLFYDYEMEDPETHTRLIEILKGLRCMVALSGYASSLYDELLSDWRRIEYDSMTRGARVAREVLWMNYPEPKALHDYQYLGQNYRERERIKRKKKRWRARLENMESLERYALLDTIQELWK